MPSLCLLHPRLRHPGFILLESRAQPHGATAGQSKTHRQVRGSGAQPHPCENLR